MCITRRSQVSLCARKTSAQEQSADLEQHISKGLFYSLFQLQEAQDQHRDAVQRAERMEGHLQKYRLRSGAPVLRKQISNVLWLLCQL